jgi:hypothetical protein
MKNEPINEHFFKVLSLSLEDRIRIRDRLKVKGRIRIWIRICIKVTGRIWIRIHIRINVMQIRNTEIVLFPNPNHLRNFGHFLARKFADT